jgi:hypothetical protein
VGGRECLIDVADLILLVSRVACVSSSWAPVTGLCVTREGFVFPLLLSLFQVIPKVLQSLADNIDAFIPVDVVVT